MTQQDKELLLKDLCAKLPYGVKVEYNGGIYNIESITSNFEVSLSDGSTDLYHIKDVKPYLRTMSSMTKEEFESSPFYGTDCSYSYGFDEGKFYFISLTIFDIETLDWLNANYFDYRELIGRNLAIAVTKENNPYKD